MALAPGRPQVQQAPRHFKKIAEVEEYGGGMGNAQGWVYAVGMQRTREGMHMRETQTPMFVYGVSKKEKLYAKVFKNVNFGYFEGTLPLVTVIEKQERRPFVVLCDACPQRLGVVVDAKREGLESVSIRRIQGLGYGVLGVSWSRDHRIGSCGLRGLCCIAALLLEGGRTTHSRFAIPINILEDSMCHIPADSDLANLIRQAKLIIWDEAPMIQSYCYEAFDRTLRYICRRKTLYESSDSVSLADDDTNFDESIYTTDFLNGIKMSGLPKHAIKLKIGTPVMLMRNIDQKAGLL
ncbi:ATP-dependent DNA helicase PIF1-like protein [Tanacetum coccineum]